MPTFNTQFFKQTAEAHGDKKLDDYTARTGVDQGRMSRILRGIDKPGFDTLTKLADSYGVPVDDLILRDPDPEPTEETAA